MLQHFISVLCIFHEVVHIKDIIKISLDLDLEPLALCMLQHLKVFIQSQQGEFILQVNPEIHVFHRVHHNVNELHARHHEIDVVVFAPEIFHQLFKPGAFITNLHEVVKG